jgi:hypothetical protein
MGAFAMEWLNYHHLFYFSVIVQEGGLAKAAARLRLSHSTLSTQLRALEEFLGCELFERCGRRLVLTPMGAEVAEYADEIFRMGAELVDVARGLKDGRCSALRVGVVDALPKTFIYRLLEPAMQAQATSRRLQHRTAAALGEPAQARERQCVCRSEFRRRTSRNGGTELASARAQHGADPLGKHRVIRREGLARFRCMDDRQ